jgi:hypothetical protein
MVHLATFEDSGKCKGYGWVTFASLAGAEAAVRGYIIKMPEGEDGDEVNDEDTSGKEAGDDKAKTKRKPKGRKWYINRYFGREIKREFAEDASVRYKKRYGGKRPEDAQQNGEAPVAEVNEAGAGARENKSSYDRREARKAQRQQNTYKVDARTIAPGAALAHAQRSSGAITEAKGQKITFD